MRIFNRTGRIFFILEVDKILVFCLLVYCQSKNYYSSVEMQSEESRLMN